MYTPQHQQQSQGYSYYAPEPHQSQGPPATNPFVAPPGPKRAPAPVPAPAPAPAPAPVPAPAKPVDPAEEQQLEWVLVPKGTPVTTPSKDVTTSPLEYRITVLKALGIHLCDPTSAAAYLETSSDTIPWPTPLELENWAGITSIEHQAELIDDIQSRVMKNQIELEKMSVILRGLLETMQQGDAPPTAAAPEPTVPAEDHEDTELPPDDDVISSDED